MKLTRIVALVMALVMMFSFFGMRAFSEEKNTETQVAVELGDINFDGNIDIEDLLLLKKHILKLIDIEELILLVPVTKHDIKTAADINRDGAIDIEDLLILKKHVLKLIVISDHYGLPQPTNVGFVDERVELITLIFRLAEKEGYMLERTDYQRELSSLFSNFKNHSAVRYAMNSLRPHPASAFNLAYHLQKVKNQFVLSKNNDFLFGGSNWTKNNVEAFVKQLNQFYIDTNFEKFFKDNTKYYEKHNTQFKKDIADKINYELFEKHGLNPGNMRLVLSPSYGPINFAHQVQSENKNETIYYATISGSADYKFTFQIVIHEFVHAITRPFVDEWYDQNEEFRKMCDDSVDLVSWLYPTGRDLASEYLTRAYTILYFAENTDINLNYLFLVEKDEGFIYIQEVYAMITEHEIIDLVFDIETILGTNEYSFGEENVFENNGFILKWQFLDLHGYEIAINNFIPTDARNIFGSQTGDVFYIVYEDSEFLYIDLGANPYWPENEQMRFYCVFPLNLKY